MYFEEKTGIFGSIFETFCLTVIPGNIPVPGANSSSRNLTGTGILETLIVNDENTDQKSNSIISQMVKIQTIIIVS